jgi:hypothetical protein
VSAARARNVRTQTGQGATVRNNAPAAPTTDSDQAWASANGCGVMRTPQR